MSLSKTFITLLLVSVFACSADSGVSIEVCPLRAEATLQYVDVFDGPPEELATLIPDNVGEHAGNWQLGYIYDAGRFVTVRCKYTDGKMQDVKLSKKIQGCTYTIDSHKTLKLLCQ